VWVCCVRQRESRSRLGNITSIIVVVVVIVNQLRRRRYPSRPSRLASK
jgi:hypothetical protein